MLGPVDSNMHYHDDATRHGLVSRISPPKCGRLSSFWGHTLAIRRLKNHYSGHRRVRLGQLPRTDSPTIRAVAHACASQKNQCALASEASTGTF